MSGLLYEPFPSDPSVLRGIMTALIDIVDKLQDYPPRHCLTNGDIHGFSKRLCIICHDSLQTVILPREIAQLDSAKSSRIGLHATGHGDVKD